MRKKKQRHYQVRKKNPYNKNTLHPLTHISGQLTCFPATPASGSLPNALACLIVTNNFRFSHRLAKIKPHIRAVTALEIVAHLSYCPTSREVLFLMTCLNDGEMSLATKYCRPQSCAQRCWQSLRHMTKEHGGMLWCPRSGKKGKSKLFFLHYANTVCSCL